MFAAEIDNDDDAVDVYVTDKVQTPNKVQTVADKVHLVSTRLQDAPCQRQFAT